METSEYNAHCVRRSGRGFTIIELAVVIAIAAILAFLAVARINTKPFSTEGYASQVAATVRYAQKIAISQRREVFVVTTGPTPGNIRLCYTSNCTSAVREPSGGGAYSIDAPANVSLSATAFSFDALGRPPGGAVTINVTGDVTRSVTVAAETGYVQYVP